MMRRTCATAASWWTAPTWPRPSISECFARRPVPAPRAAKTSAGGTDLVVAQAGTTDMTEGEVRKVDKDTKKITIRHGEIKNLDMPGMTMLFQVKDPAMLTQVKVGDKIDFVAEDINGALTVTKLQKQ